MSDDPPLAERSRSQPGHEDGRLGVPADATPALRLRSGLGGLRAPRLHVVVWGAIALLFALDLARPPQRQASARVLLTGIHLYQHLGRGPTVAMGVRCRFTPTCSRYAEAAVRQDGALFGGLRAAWRILRCGPWTAKGTNDPA